MPLLLTLAAVQFTHIVDFMIMMPLGPQFMRLFAIGPQQFGFMVSAYTFAAAASGFVAAFWIDRFDRRRALLTLYGGFIVATALCGVAPELFHCCSVARIIAGTFGGVLGGLTFAIVADLVPYARRATATAVVAPRSRWRRSLGVPLSLWIAAHYSWRAPFLVLAGVQRRSVGLGGDAPDSAACGARRGASAAVARWSSCAPIFGVPNHLRAFAFIIVLDVLGVHGRPVHRRRTTSPMSASRRRISPCIYFAGRRDDARHGAGDRPACRPLRQASASSRFSR